jgi:DNA helicase-2/ATP-dependent DNA helicase PcrA
VTEALLASGLVRTLQRQRGWEAERRLGRLRALVRAGRDYQAEGDEPSLAGFLAGAALVGDTEAESDDGSRVSLATIHAAKGLEFRCVRIVGLEEGTLPHRRALADGGLEEERRLCYVAMTRAQERLGISRGGKQAHGMLRTPSRFITDANG